MRNESTTQLPGMSANGHVRSRKPLPPLANVALVLGLLAIPLGVIQWVWTADWRWVITGLMLTLILLVVAGAINGVKARGR